MENNNRFGDYLKELIKKAGLTQNEFYSALGIKKPYFYDIVSGRVNPPPHSLQFKSMEILRADEETKESFYDLAAKERGDIPADITKLVKDNPDLLVSIRSDLKRLTTCD